MRISEDSVLTFYYMETSLKTNRVGEGKKDFVAASNAMLCFPMKSEEKFVGEKGEAERIARPNTRAGSFVCVLASVGFRREAHTSSLIILSSRAKHIFR